MNPTALKYCREGGQEGVRRGEDQRKTWMRSKFRVWWQSKERGEVGDLALDY